MERFSLSVPLALFRVIPSLLVFTKLLKVPIVLLRKLKVGLIIYPDDILLMASKEELEKERGTLIFFIQHLSFVINAKKSVLCSTKIIEFLGIIMTLSSTVLAVLPAPLMYRYLQKQQIDE